PHPAPFFSTSQLLDFSTLLISIVALSTAALAQAPAERQQIEQKLAAERAAAEELSRREVGLLSQQAALERLIELESRALKAAQARLKQGSKRLEAGEQRLQLAETELSARSRAIGPRLTARYRMGREGLIRFVLGARSIGEVLRRKRLFTALLESDFAAIKELHASAERSRLARDELHAAR